ncbi:FAD/NAD(P)-binding protein [Sphingobacterium griseoflavum]|uniref:FAD/NAD(P) binding domain-containing protein n=1 Tax=Sphingobacterium griseoflavum TaxID=1474952 RepID=A0ABQ3HWJ3_9SPHI|nr:FAD/NAD(P)-binding protein [Sphingobacterium griseoflavum]GHE33167.1 FAD/NAD(P) binding domain-containing protein [Sphingobacterium griseoflavum]
MTYNKSTTIAIIGAGASGTACFLQLVLKHIVRKPANHLRLIIFEKRTKFGEGLAFGTGQEGHLLNTKAGLMGIFPHERMHFVQWMHENQDLIARKHPQVSVHPDAFPPRMLFGEYVQDMFATHRQLAEQHGIKVDLVSSEVVDGKVGRDNKITLITDNDESFQADYSILATGNPASNSFTKLLKQPNFFPSPWPSSRLLKHIKNKKARVSIVGSSLTAIDALITLIDNGHEGPISFFSLKGLLPRVQSPVEIPYQRRILTLANVRKSIREKAKPLRLTDLIRMFRQEAESHLEKKLNWVAEEREHRDQLALLEEDIALATGKQCLLQNILYSLREETYPIWRLLPVDQKLLFLKWIKPYFDINRHAMPIENAIKIQKVLQSGQLKIIGNTDDIVWKAGRFILTTDDGTSNEADYVVNASGPTVVVEEMIDQPLLPKLLKRGYIEQHPAGGICADLESLRVCHAKRKSPSPYYVIGHQLAGLQLDINALWFNVEQADILTDDLLKNIS